MEKKVIGRAPDPFGKSSSGSAKADVDRLFDQQKDCNSDMARPKVRGRNQPYRKKDKVVVIAMEVALPRSTQAKLPLTGGKGTDKG
uniref:Uncharacterized protein n=1 Tax=Solanum tuberosum TaxID=4113 RepID=M1DP36_SOLTU